MYVCSIRHGDPKKNNNDRYFFGLLQSLLRLSNNDSNKWTLKLSETIIVLLLCYQIRAVNKKKGRGRG